MRKSIYTTLSVLVLAKFFILVSCSSLLYSHPKDINLIWGNWSQDKIETLLSKSADQESPGKKIEFISKQFIGTMYKENTLTGDENTREVLTINLDGMDCFTYLDYVEALSISNSFKEFIDNLKQVRYKEGKVNYKNRKHFFSDWLTNKNIIDVTKEIAPEKFLTVSKNLNQKSDTELYLKNIPVVKRHISYIPSEEIKTDTLNKLKNGDYIGIFTNAPGLDVSHTGIIVKKNGNTFLRHASSKKTNMKVVDEDFLDYVKETPGIVVYRKVS